MVVGGSFTLNSGHEIPLVGLGISGIHEELGVAVEQALLAGYRLFDTARIYNNEERLGQVLKEKLEALGIKREEVFITTKVPIVNENTVAEVEKSITDSLQRLQVEYLDLVLIHYPKDRFTGIDGDREANVKARKLVYQKLEEYVDQGVIRSIGVANYEPYHLHELFQFARIKPSINQFEYHPYLTKPQTVEVTRQYGIFPQAFSSLLTGNKEIFTEPLIIELAKKYAVSEQTILYAFALNTNLGIIPKSATPSRIISNLKDVIGVKFTDSEIAQLLDLDRNAAFSDCSPWRVL
ncbi:unnamed protein product [Caenorhabditis angaria]|uniref:NADP-dependent oxidoreductase domain-containing protein n=1 Tax=Caenorhabditis angaria TaxID=860376 RepID=A0A9P1J0W2_9PELO|nr:unnamed protein product [Caenorhabditis angaria]